MIERPTFREQGFTLVEVMISLLIFALLAAAGVAILSFSVRAQAATGKKLDDIGAVERLDSVLSADLAQAVIRPARNQAGDTLPAFFGATGSTTEPMIRLVRGGWSNLDNAPRASVQKVEYRFVEGAIERDAYPMLDGAAPMPGSKLVDHVRGVSFRYRLAGAWSDHWDGSGGAPLPQAMEMQLVRDDGTTLRLLYLVGTGQVPEAPGAPR
ncbi:MAG: type II secretion system minor pseudopilin GspJ [Pseudomonadota bacterium]|nr:type II secretion system minor pseudopilin GspJ [Pseudomonadota bacterium]